MYICYADDTALYVSKKPDEIINHLFKLLACLCQMGGFLIMLEGKKRDQTLGEGGQESEDGTGEVHARGEEEVFQSIVAAESGGDQGERKLPTAVENREYCNKLQESTPKYR